MLLYRVIRVQVEYADAIRETSLPMYQHVISEGHVLLRNQLLQNNSLTTTPRRDIEKVLAQNCFSLADSLCSDTRGPKVVTSIAAKYLILSGVGVDNVVEHITSQSSQASLTLHTLSHSPTHTHSRTFTEERFVISNSSQVSKLSIGWS